MAETVLSPVEIEALAERHPNFAGATLRHDQGRVYQVFVGANSRHLLMLTLGQVEHIVWKLASHPEKELTFNQQAALNAYAMGLYRGRQTETAYNNRLIKGDSFVTLPGRSPARYVTGIPEGPPARLHNVTLRTMLGNRCPWLDDVFFRGADLYVDCFDGDTGYDHGKVIARWPRGTKLEILPDGEHVIGTNYWRDVIPEVTGKRLQMAAGPAHSSSQNAKKPAPPRLPPPCYFDQQMG